MPRIRVSTSPSLKLVGLLLPLLVLSALPLLPVHAQTQTPTTTITIVENWLTDAPYVTQGPGPTVNDEATVAGTPGSPAPTGTVTYSFYMDGTCGGPPAFTQTVVLGPGDESSPQGPLTSGAYSFQATYNGDSNNLPSTGACEPITVTGASAVPEFPVGPVLLFVLLVPALLALRRKITLVPLAR